MEMVRLLIGIRRLSKSKLLLTTTAITATTLLLFITTNTNTNTTTTETKTASRPIAAVDATKVYLKDVVAETPFITPTTLLRRSNCQIIYVLGVEGSLHHGFMPVLKALAEQQIDPATGSKYHVVKGHEVLRDTIFGSSSSSKKKKKMKEFDKLLTLPLKDPQLVQDTLDAICPSFNPDGNGENNIGEEEEEIQKRHIILEGNSFPSGRPDDDDDDHDNTRLTTSTTTLLRVRRQKDWQTMTPHEIASSPHALQHPTNLYEFYNAFSPYVDVRFVVLHRPYLDTIASHAGFDSGPVQHSNVISGFLLLLSRFLVSHMYYYHHPYDDSSPLDGVDGRDRGSGGDDGLPLWTIVCTEQLSSKEFETQQQLQLAREAIVSHLATFLGWPIRSCPHCFNNWRESSKAPPELRLGEATTHVLLDHVKALEGIWPPQRIEDGLPQQQCRM